MLFRVPFQVLATAISIKRAFDVRKMDECSGNEHFKSKIIPDRQINCKIITLKSSTLQRVCRIFYFRFLSVRLNRLKNKLLANYLRNRGNDLATVRNSAFCVAILSNNSFICKYNIFFRKYELSVAIL